MHINFFFLTANSRGLLLKLALCWCWYRCSPHETNFCNSFVIKLLTTIVVDISKHFNRKFTLQIFSVFWMQLRKFELFNTKHDTFPANICLFKVSNRNTRKRYEICSKQTIKTPELRQWRHSGIFTVSFEDISHLFFNVFIVDFE